MLHLKSRVLAAVFVVGFGSASAFAQGGAAGAWDLTIDSPQGANTVTAHKLSTIIYHLLKYKEDYIDVDRIIYEEKFRRSRLSRLCKQAKELGYELVQNQKPA